MHGSCLHDDSWASRLHGATLNEAARNTGRGTQTHSESNQRLHVRSYLSLCKFAFLVIWKFHFTESSISCSVRVCAFPFLHERWDNYIHSVCTSMCVSGVIHHSNTWKLKSLLWFSGRLFFFFFFEGEMSHGSGSLKETSHNPQLSQCV